MGSETLTFPSHYLGSNAKNPASTPYGLAPTPKAQPTCPRSSTCGYRRLMWPRVPSGSLASSVSRTACTVVARGCRVSASTWGTACVTRAAWARRLQIGKGKADCRWSEEAVPLYSVSPRWGLKEPSLDTH